MALVGLRGKEANKELLHFALEHTPSLVVDCANVANPHAFSAYIPVERFMDVFIMEVDLIYTFRDTVKRLRGLVDELGVHHIVITSFNHLFHYDDEEENKNILEHTWEMLSELGEHYEIHVGVHKSYEDMAKRYCDSWG